MGRDPVGAGRRAGESVTLEHRDLAVLAPPENLTSANQRRWLAVQQSQVNQDALRAVLSTGRDVLVGSPFIGAVFAFALISALEKGGVFGDNESNILKGLVVADSFVGAIGSVGSAIKGFIP